MKLSDSFPLLGIFISIVGLSSALPTCVVDPQQRVPCSKAYNNAGNFSVEGKKIYAADSCLADGCCWMRGLDTKTFSTDCYQSVESDAFGYKLRDFKEDAFGLTASLELINSGSSVYGPDIKKLSLNVIYHTEDMLEVKITDASTARWEIPESVISRPKPKKTSLNQLKYAVSYASNPFTLQIKRLSDGEIIFNLDSLLIFKDQYLEFSLLSDNAGRNTYGLGESTRLKQALQVNKMYTLWAVDLASMFLSENLYGSLPFYLQTVVDPKSPNLGKAHGGLLMNSNGMDISVLADRINFKVLGGILDFYVFAGGSAKDVVQQSTAVVGKPAMVPFWSLGFHNCRWGYTGLQEIEEIVANYSAAGIPLDVQWFDIDYMSGYRDFTVNQTAYPMEELTAFINGLHTNGQRIVPIIDPGIRVDANGDDAYDKGLALDLFVKDIAGNNYLAQVWPGPVHFPDFLNPSAQVTEHHEKFFKIIFLIFNCLSILLGLLDRTIDFFLQDFTF
jgi:alpha-glucosidase (family GH31 glycosyl hydrolase)